MHNSLVLPKVINKGYGIFALLVFIPQANHCNGSIYFKVG